MTEIEEARRRLGRVEPFTAGGEKVPQGAIVGNYPVGRLCRT